MPYLGDIDKWKESPWGSALDMVRRNLEAVPAPGTQGAAMLMTPEGRAELYRKGLLTAPVMKAGEQLGDTLSGAGKVAGYPFRLLFGGVGEEPEKGKPGEWTPSMSEMNMAAALGMASPTAGQAPGLVEGALGFGQQAPPRADEWMTMGQMPTFTPPPKWQDLPYDSAAFDKARGALKEPEPIAGPGKMEQIARLLGGMAAGARGGLTPGTAAAGSSTAAALAGAGGGSGAVVGQLSQEEMIRQREFRQRQQQYQARSAELEASIAQAKNATDRYNHMGRQHQLNIEWQNTQRQEAMRAPRFQVIGAGQVMFQQTTPDGQVQYKTVDFMEDWRMATLQAKLAQAQAGGEIWIGGDNTLPIESVPPQWRQAILTAHQNMLDPGFQQKVAEYMEDKTGLNMGDLLAQVTAGQLDWSDAQTQFLFAAIELMGLNAQQMVADIEAQGAGAGAPQQRPGTEMFFR